MSDAGEQQLGQYQLTELIRRNAMSAIYKAYQPSLARFVAIKVLFSEGDPQFALRFKRSARMSAGLQHPNILQTYDFGEQGDRLFLVLQYVESGATLESLLGAPLALANAAQIMLRLLDALDYAHKRGIIHRDVKPANIMMPTPSWPLLGDFGIAKLRSDTQRVTSSGQTIGTPAYMSPEQATGRPLDARTDLYTAGLVFYTMLTGRVPFDAESPMDMLFKHVYDSPIPPRSLNPNIPPEIEQLLLRSLEKNSNARYQTAPEFAEAIRTLAPEPVQTQLHDRIASLYHASAQALEAGHWTTAIDLLGQLTALEPDYEDAAELLDIAREAQRNTRGAGGRLEAIHRGAERARQPIAQGEAPGQAHDQAAQPAGALAIPLACPRCGRAIQPDWSACPYCRETLSGLAPVLVPPEPPATGAAPASTAKAPARATPRRRSWAAPAALLILLGLGAGAAFALTRGAPPQQPPATQAAIASAPTAQTRAAAAPPTTAPTTKPITPPTAPPTAAPASLPPTARPVTVAPPTAAPPDAVVNLDQLRLRNGPSTNFASQHSYTRGTALIVIGKEKSGTWLKVQAPDEQLGWMRAADLQLNVALGTLPIVEAPPSPTPTPTSRPRPTATATPSITPTATNTAVPTTTPSPTEVPATPDGTSVAAETPAAGTPSAPSGASSPTATGVSAETPTATTPSPPTDTPNAPIGTSVAAETPTATTPTATTPTPEPATAPPPEPPTPTVQ